MGDVVVAGEAADGEGVLAALQHGQFDLILLDLTMPGVNGVELIEHIRAQYEDLPILVFSMHTEVSVAKRLIKTGVSGYITKGCENEMLMTAIRKVAGGASFVDPLLAEQMMFARPQASGAGAHLSERELQILKLLGQGMSVNAIADELFINSRTVSSHKARLMLKMNFKNNADLVLYVSESGLI
jgi:DNA-binding NarL/FixJ family response regulator